MHFERILKINEQLERKSLFLFGPRQTGKTTYLKSQFNNVYKVNLLRPKDFIKYKSKINLFGEEIQYQIKNNNVQIIIVDEIQKIPELLDEVHFLIEEYKFVRFILTGSSARKLKKAGANLLGGRASRINFHPIVSIEYGIQNYAKNLVQNLTYGFLPSVLNSKNPWAELEDYVALYLKEEIQQEAVVRSLEGFSRFLNIVACTNGEQVNFTSLGSDAQVPPRTIKEYYQILEDTLIGNLLPAYTETKIRKAMTTAKFYLFDPGVTNALLGRTSISEKTIEFGNLFEQAIYCELKAYLDYHGIQDSIYYWRSTSMLEVDFLIKNKNNEWIGIEVKSTENPKNKDMSGLIALEEDLKLKKKIIVCRASSPRLIEFGIEILPLQNFLEQLWNGKLI